MMNVIEQINHIPLFQNLSTPELERLSLLCQTQSYPAQAKVIREGDSGFDFYVVLSGSVSVEKKSETGAMHQITTIAAGGTFGEIAFLEGGLRGADVRALEPIYTIRVDGSQLRSSEYADILAKLMAAMAKMLSERLKFTNKVTVRSMQAEVFALQKQVATGLMLTSILFLAAGYEFTLGLVLSLKEYFSSTTPISVLMIVGYAIVLFLTIWRGGYPLASYGLTWRGGWQSFWQAIAYSLPVMAFILLVKWVLITHVDFYAGNPLFQPTLVLKGAAATSLTAFAITVGAYALFCPVQEFIVRGALQSSLQMFLKNNRKSIIISVVLSNLVFASSHMHTSYKFALLAFIPGLFWGWMYNKQRSLVGVSVSHILIGVWVSFVVGLPGLH